MGASRAGWLGIVQLFTAIGGHAVSRLDTASTGVESLLYETAPTDPLTMSAAGVLFAVVALLACWVPARRAAQIDLLDALREG